MVYFLHLRECIFLYERIHIHWYVLLIFDISLEFGDYYKHAYLCGCLIHVDMYLIFIFDIRFAINKVFNQDDRCVFDQRVFDKNADFSFYCVQNIAISESSSFISWHKPGLVVYSYIFNAWLHIRCFNFRCILAAHETALLLAILPVCQFILDFCDNV